MGLLFLIGVLSISFIVSANTVEFVNQDSHTRTIYFTAQERLQDLDSLTIFGDTNATAMFPAGWIGNFYSVSEGADNVPGMLGEVCWDGWLGMTWFDVSAIVNCNDMNGVKTIAPKYSRTPISGCESYENGCNNAYYHYYDIQTKSTAEKDLICTIGTRSPSMKEV